MHNLKIGVVGIKGAWSTEVLADSLESKTGFRRIIDLNQVRWDLANKAVHFEGEDLLQYDAIIVKKISKTYSPECLNRLHLLSWLNSQGVSVFSDPNDMGRLINRLSCTTALNTADIPMPPTTITESVEEARAAIGDYEEAVLKPLFSTKARGMTLLKADNPALIEQLVQFQNEFGLFYIQKKIPLPGKDLGLMFLGGEYIGTYARVAASDSWNTTTRDGGKYASHTPRESTIAIAKKAQQAFNLAFTTVDVVETDDDSETVIFEVSAFGGFRGAKEALDIDIADLYSNYVINQISNKA